MVPLVYRGPTPDWGVAVITRATVARRNDDGPEALTRAVAIWTAYRQRLAMPAERVQDAPSQILAGFAAWRKMTVCKHTGKEA